MFWGDLWVTQLLKFEKVGDLSTTLLFPCGSEDFSSALLSPAAPKRVFPRLSLVLLSGVHAVNSLSHKLPFRINQGWRGFKPTFYTHPPNKAKLTRLPWSQFNCKHSKKFSWFSSAHYWLGSFPTGRTDTNLFLKCPLNSLAESDGAPTCRYFGTENFCCM